MDRQEAARRTEEAAKQRVFEAEKGDLLSNLSFTGSAGTAPTPGGAQERAAIRQLACSVSRSQHAATYYRSGDYREAYRFSQAAFGEAPASRECRVGTVSIPPVPPPVDEMDSPEAQYFETLYSEITKTVRVLSSAGMDVEKARKKTLRADQQIGRQQALVERLEQAPASPQRDEGLDKANDLLAKAKALLAEARAAEVQANEELEALSGEKAYLDELENKLTTALAENQESSNE